MTPRRAGWLTGAVVFLVMAGVAAITRNAAAADNAVTDGVSELAPAIRVILLATAAGLLVAAIVGSTGRRRAATVAPTVAAVLAYCVTAVWVWWQSTNSPRAPGEDPVSYALGLLEAFVTAGTAVALVASALVWWIVRHAVGRDGAERVLALETSSLFGERDRWGAAMRAELASIDDQGQRSRFARSAGVLALRRGTGRWPVVLAAVAGVGAGLVVFSAARISFNRPGDRGLIGEPVLGLVLLLLIATVLAGTLIGRSFRAGLETALLAWVSVYVCSVAVEVPQALAWYNEEGILLLDGEGAETAGVDAVGAALQPITHFAFVFTSVSQLVIALLAAAFGATLLHFRRH